MNKTININLAGFSFTIEEQAYESLKTYLEAIKAFLAEEQDVDEIITDIERRIAELMQERLKEDREVLDQEDVEHVMEVLGDPSYFKTDPDESEEETTGKRKRSKTRKVYRNPDNVVIGGVCSGLGAYFNADPVIFRLIFVISLLVWGVGIVPYLILWAVIPEAKTTAEKLEMEGEDVTVENIKNRFKKESENVKESFRKFKDGKGGKTGQQVSSAIQQMFDFLLTLISMIWSVLKKVLGVAAILIGSLLCITALLVFLGVLFGLSFISIGELGSFSSLEVAQLFFENGSDLNFLIFTGLLFLFTLVGGLLVSGFAALGFKPKNKAFIGISIPVVLIISLCLFIAFLGSAVLQFDDKGRVTQKVELNQFPSDTLIIGVNEDIYFSPDFKHHESHHLDLLSIKDDDLISGRVFLDVERSNTDAWQVEVRKYAYGKSVKQARDKAAGINYNWSQRDGHLWFDPTFSWDRNLKYRRQEVRVTVYVPEGKYIYLADGTDRIIYDIDNVQNMFDGKMIEKYWHMSDKGLSLAE